jgi:hypothetical protein
MSTTTATHERCTRCEEIKRYKFKLGAIDWIALVAMCHAYDEFAKLYNSMES